MYCQNDAAALIIVIVIIIILIFELYLCTANMILSLTNLPRTEPLSLTQLTYSQIS